MSMASISLNDLVQVLAEHPEYRERWLADVPAEKALYIKLAEGRQERQLESETYDAVDVALVVLDRDSDGRVCGIEIA